MPFENGGFCEKGGKGRIAEVSSVHQQNLLALHLKNAMLSGNDSWRAISLSGLATSFVEAMRECTLIAFFSGMKSRHPESILKHNGH